jgi:hypothetical protein
MAGGDVRQLAHMPEALKLYLRAFREALRALRTVGVPLRPSATRLVEWIPDPILVFGLHLFFDTRLAVVEGLGRTFDSSADEMKELADEFRGILRQSGLPSPASDVLFAQVEARFQAGGSGFTNAPPTRSVA